MMTAVAVIILLENTNELCFERPFLRLQLREEFFIKIYSHFIPLTGFAFYDLISINKDHIIV